MRFHPAIFNQNWGGGGALVAAFWEGQMTKVLSPTQTSDLTWQTIVGTPGILSDDTYGTPKSGHSADVGNTWWDYWKTQNTLPTFDQVRGEMTGGFWYAAMDQKVLEGLLISDTFTGTNGTSLAAHTPDYDSVGSGWTIHNNTISIDAAGRAAPSTNSPGSGTVWSGATIDAGVADVDISVDMWVNGNWNYYQGVVLRWQDWNNYVRVVRYLASGVEQIRLQKIVGGVTTTLLNPSVTYTDGQSLRVTAVGSNYEIFHNGGSIGTTTDVDLNTNTNVGLYNTANWNINTSVYYEWDNFQVLDLS